MSDKSTNSDVQYARQLQEKFELYLLALIFTLLGLAIQTAKFGVSDIVDVLEILGWFALLVSGLTGLSRIEWVPVTLKTHSELLKIKDELQQLSDAAAQGIQEIAVVDQDQPAEITEIISDRRASIARIEARVKSLERTILRKYSIHKWAFVSALCLLIGARSFLPIEAIAKKHLTLRCDMQFSAVVGQTQ